VARARMSRSELKARDEITTTLERLTENAMTRKNEIVVGLVVLLVLAAGFFGWRYYSSSKNAAAQGQLANVISAFQDTTVKEDKERFEKTIVAAQKTMADYSGSQAASLAQYYMALSQDGLGDMPNAVKNLEEVIARGDSDTRPIAQFALASVYKRNNELQKAVDVLKQLDASGGFTKAVVAYEFCRRSGKSKGRGPDCLFEGRDGVCGLSVPFGRGSSVETHGTSNSDSSSDFAPG